MRNKKNHNVELAGKGQQTSTIPVENFKDDKKIIAKGAGKSRANGASSLLISADALEKKFHLIPTERKENQEIGKD
jgi:hypothetical protein